MTPSLTGSRAISAQKRGRLYVDDGRMPQVTGKVGVLGRQNRSALSFAFWGRLISRLRQRQYKVPIFTFNGVEVCGPVFFQSCSRLPLATSSIYQRIEPVRVVTLSATHWVQAH